MLYFGLKRPRIVLFFAHFCESSYIAMISAEPNSSTDSQRRVSHSIQYQAAFEKEDEKRCQIERSQISAFKFKI
jgi:hypothetical protein